MNEQSNISMPSRRGVRRLPPWLKRPLPGLNEFGTTRRIVADSGVATVCQEAKCPNLSECWANRHAAFMILGDVCTRNCGYCAVKNGIPDPPANDEPQRLANSVAELRLIHAVITSVSRDDLADGGAEHFARCVRAIRHASPKTTIEVLPSDFDARVESVRAVCDSGPDLYNHNLEMVERLVPSIRPQGDYQKSLEVLRIVKQLDAEILTKSGLMVGLGETSAELQRTFTDLRAVDCDVLTVGQYISPTRDGHVPVKKFYTPDEFDEMAELAKSMGFLGVACGPFVRSSYNASEVFEKTKTAATSRR